MYVRIMITNIMLSLLAVFSSTAISPALSTIANNFSHIDPVNIKLIITIPFLIMIPCALLSEKLCNFFGRRNALIFCTLLFFLAGIAPAFINNFYLIIFFRVLLGISVGFAMPMTGALIPEYLPLHLRGQMMGLSTAACNLAGIAVAFFAGIVAIYSWRANFLFYFFGLIALACVLAYIPKSTILELKQRPNNIKNLPISVYLMCLVLLLSSLASYCVLTDISFLIADKFSGDASLTGKVLSLYTAAAFIGSLLLGTIKKYFGSGIAILATICQCFALFIIYSSTNTYMLYIGIFIQGMFGGIIIPAIFILNAEFCELNQQVKAMGIANSLMFFGSFFSPIFINLIKKTLGYTSINSTYLIASIWMFFVCIFCIIVYIKFLSKKPKSALV